MFPDLRLLCSAFQVRTGGNSGPSAHTAAIVAPHPLLHRAVCGYSCAGQHPAVGQSRGCSEGAGGPASPCWAPYVCWELQRGPQVWGAAVITVPHGPPSWSCPTAVLHRLLLCWALGRELMGAGWGGPGGGCAAPIDLPWQAAIPNHPPPSAPCCAAHCRAWHRGAAWAAVVWGAALWAAVARGAALWGAAC